MNELERAERNLRTRVQSAPHDATAYAQLAQVLMRLGRFQEALTSYDTAIETSIADADRDPNRRDRTQAEETNGIRSLTDLYIGRGTVLQAMRRPQEALASYDAAVRLMPDNGEVHFNLGNVLAELARFDEALRSYDHAIAHAPAAAAAYFNRANVRRALRQFDRALADYDRAIALRPQYANAYNNRGATQFALGKLDEAMASYAQAIRLSPGLAEAYFNRANALRQSGRREDALASYRQALDLNPHYADALNNMGGLLAELMRPDEALTCYGKAIELAPHVAATHVNQGNLLRDAGRLDEARASYEKALTLQPDLEFLYGTWLHSKMMLCDWQNLAAHLAALSDAIAGGEKVASPFTVTTMIDSEQIQRRAAELWVAARHPPIAVGAGRPIGPGRRIRLGYYSSDFRDHATMFLIAGLFEQHDRSRFEVLGFSFGPDTGDSMRQRAAAGVDRFLDVRNESDAEVAALSRRLGIDIAIDLKGFTQGHRAGIFARRAAPIQVSYLGFPGTMGASYMDYLMADRTIVPEANVDNYRERIAYLPRSYQINDRLRRIAETRPTRPSMGLPQTAVVFCCFNNSYKITPKMFDRWSSILKRVDNSVMWLLEDGPTIVRNLRKEAGARGLDGERLVFAKRVAPTEHLARLRLADLFLDTLPCNAHTTASDALWAGLPVLTCTGQTFAGRVAASLLKAVGLPELVTTTLEHYEQLAIGLATDPPALERLRSKLEQNRLSSPLFDTAATTQQIEALYVQMYERYRTNQAPAQLQA